MVLNVWLYTDGSGEHFGSIASPPRLAVHAMDLTETGRLFGASVVNGVGEGFHPVSRLYFGNFVSLYLSQPIREQPPAPSWGQLSRHHR